MFQVEFFHDDLWTVIDEDGEVAFVGTKREAEDWLDFQDNARRRRAPPGGWLRNSLKSLRRLLTGQIGRQLCFAKVRFQPI